MNHCCGSPQDPVRLFVPRWYNDIVALEDYHRGYADGYRTGFNDASNRRRR